MRLKRPSRKTLQMIVMAIVVVAALRVMLGLVLNFSLSSFEFLLKLSSDVELKNTAVSLALDKINDRLYGRLTIGSFEGGLTDRMVIADLVITDADGKEAVRINRLTIDGLMKREPGQKALITITADQVWIRAEKTAAGWNLSRLYRKKPPTGKPRKLPHLTGKLFINSLTFELSSQPGREHRMIVTESQVELETRDNYVAFKLTGSRGSLSPPPVALERVVAEGAAHSTGSGWDLRFNHGELETKDSIALISDGHYYTYDKTLSASLERFEIGLETMNVLWPGNPLIAPVLGAGKVEGDTKLLSFDARFDPAAGGLSAIGTYEVRTGRIQAEGGLQGFSPSKLVKVNFPVSGLYGSFDLDYQPARKKGAVQNAGVRPEQRQINATLYLDSFFHPQYRSVPVNALVEMLGDNYTVSASSREADRALSFFAKGVNLAPYPITAKLEFKNLSPARFKPGWPEARLTGLLTINGRGRSFEGFLGQGALTLESSEIYRARIQDASLAYQLAHGRITTDHGEAVIENIYLVASGWLEPMKKSFPFSFDLSFEVSDETAVAALTKNALEARSGSARLKLAGTKNNWTAEGGGELSKLSIKGVPAEQADLLLNLTGRGGDRIAGKVTLELAKIKPPSLGRGAFQLPLFDLSLSTTIYESPFREPRLDFEVATDSEDPDYALFSQGILVLGNRGAFTLGLKDLDLRVIGEDWRLSLPTWIESGEGKLLIRFFNLKSGNQTIGINGEISRQLLNMTLLVSNFQLEPWAEKLLPGNSIEGAFTGSLALTGSQAVPELDGQFSMEALRVKTARLEQLEGSLNQKGDRLHFAMRANSASASDLRSWGELPLEFSFAPFSARINRDRSMDVKIRVMDMAAGLFEPFLPWVRELGGNVSIVADLQGTPREPLWSGWSRLENVQFEVPSWGLSLSGVSGRAELENNLVRIPELAAVSGGGDARISGEILLKGFGIEEFKLNLTARNFKAMNSPVTRASLDADLKLRGDLEFPRVKGEVKFTDLIYRPPLILAYQGMAWESEDQTIQVKGEEVKAESSPLLDRAELDLKVGIPDTGTLRNQELNVRFGGDLEVKKFPGSFFLIFGKVESKSGWLNFQGKPFQVERGVFVFPAIPVIDPDLDILGSYRAPGYMTYIKITGVLSQPVLEVYSDPPLDPADVLAVILFGRPVSELAQGERESLARTGGQLAAGYAAAELASSLGTALSLDAIVISAGETAEESGIGVGKYLSDKLYVFYYHQFSEQAAEEFKVRYDVTKRFSIEASQDAQGQGGVDVYYTFTY